MNCRHTRLYSTNLNVVANVLETGLLAYLEWALWNKVREREHVDTISCLSLFVMCACPTPGNQTTLEYRLHTAEKRERERDKDMFQTGNS